MANNPQSSGLQFRPMAPTQQGQPFIPVASQQLQPVGHGLPSSNIGMPPVQGQPHQYSQQMQQPAWPSHPGHALPTSQAVPMQYAQASRPLQSGSSLPQQAAPPYAQFVPPYGQPQNNATVLPQFQPIPQMQAPATPAGGQPWLSSGSHSAVPVTSVQTTAQQPSSTYSDQGATGLNAQSSSDWQEHTAADGRRYYYNKKTKQSSWEKPFELMTPIERADASTVWKEFTTPEGKKYYYNKVTKQSKWTIPEELKLAREQAQRAAADGAQSIDTASPATTVAISAGETSSATASINADSLSTQLGVTSSSLAVTPVTGVNNSASAIPVGHSTVGSDVASVANAAAFPAAVSGSNAVPAPLVNNQTKIGLDNQDHISQAGARSADGTFIRDSEERRNDVAAVAKVNAAPSEERASDDEPLVFANKQEAKNAFKALLESAGVRSDWTWEQAMREIIDDKRYGGLKTPGERKQAFNEYLGQRKKIEAEERRMRQKKAREEFMKMLEESKELTSSMKWSKAVSMFENDERFKAVERARDREDLFDNYVVELERKERELAAEEHRRNVEEYRKFLESCDYIKVNSQWRKVQDRLEDDERCLRLEKLDRLLIYQDYIRDLERAEEEQKKLLKEQLRRAERKNRDEFRKLMEEHVAAGILTAKTHWLDYCLKVKDLPQYHAVATNTSGSKPKDLFEDVFEELENQYHDDRALVKDVMKSGKVNIVSTSTLEDFKAAVSDAVGSPAISDINLKLLYEEQIDRAKEKEEKEAKKRQHLADDFTQLLCTFKEITASSSWENCKPLLEESEEYRLIEEESFAREVFEEYVLGLQEKVKEKERKREEEKAKKEKDREEKEKRKEKERKEKDKDKERERDKGKERTKKDDTDSENVDGTDGQSHKEDRKKERKHRKRHHSANDDVSSDKDEKEESKKSRRHGSDRKKSRKHAYSPESDSESHHKRHKRDHKDSSRKSGGKEELEDGELGEDGEIR